MSVDPLGTTGAAEIAALVDAELASLAANAQALQSLVAQNQGMVLAARVLASNGLTDLLEIAGMRVSASLPPTVHPGDLLQVQVTGTAENGSIQLQIVADEGPVAQQPTAPPPVQNQLPPIIPAAQPAATTPAAPSAAPAPQATPTPVTPAAALPSPAPGTSAPPPIAPPASSVAVSAQAAGAPAFRPPPLDVPAPEAGSVFLARVVATQGRSDVLLLGGRRVAVALPEPVAVGSEVPVRVVAVEGESIRLQVLSSPGEAPAAGATLLNGRLLPANVLGTLLAGTTPRPASASGAPATPQSSPTAAAPGRSVPQPPPSASTAASAAAGVRPPTGTAGIPVRSGMVSAGEPTSIEARLAASRAATPPPEPAQPSESAPVADGLPSARAVAPPLLGRAPISTTTPRFVAPPPVEPRLLDAPATAVPAPRPSGLSAYTEPVALLRALRLPVTPSGVAAATIALERPAQLPAALAALENALPRASDDPHVATLRTLLAFVGRIDPRSPALSAQIAAFVDQVATGGEAKLAVLLAAAEVAEPTQPPGAQPVPPAGSDAAAAAEAAAVRPLAAALAAERAAALGVDFKQTLLALAADSATSPALGNALTGALTALTSIQAEAAQALAVRPDGFAFTLPLVTPDGFTNAHIAVSRDAGDGRGRSADAANFHIAFILETKHYGTIAIDVMTVDREVTVDVRAEAAPAVRAFRDALGHLTTRLEALHYRVASAGATLAPTTTIGVTAPGPVRPVDPNATVDRSA
jgi:hypothetical protein